MNELIEQCREAQALGLEKIELNITVVINLLERIESVQKLVERQSELIEKLALSMSR